MNLVAARSLARNAILILGSPRSGTSWLAKIIDSHPNVLYRHEPDEVCAFRRDLPIIDQLAYWIAENRVRVATKAPFFRKSWLPGPLSPLHNAIAKTLNACDRVLGDSLCPPMPDFGAAGKPETRVALKLVAWDGTEAARVLPDTRSLLILRHPCGQIASSLRGTEENVFKTPPPPDELRAIMGFARSRGMSFQEYDQQSEAAKIAWIWVYFNETIIEMMASLPNIKLVIYEQLCEAPETVSRDLFKFVGLDWSDQTSDFIHRSTNQDQAGYYTVSRNSLQAAERWRTTMRPADQAAVKAVVALSSLKAYWPDLHTHTS